MQIKVFQAEKCGPPTGRSVPSASALSLIHCVPCVRYMCQPSPWAHGHPTLTLILNFSLTISAPWGTGTRPLYCYPSPQCWHWTTVESTEELGFQVWTISSFFYLGFGVSPKHPVMFHWCSYSRVWELNPGSCMPHMGSSHFTVLVFFFLPIFLPTPSLDVFFALGTQGALTGWLMLVPITSVSEWS